MMDIAEIYKGFVNNRPALDRSRMAGCVQCQWFGEASAISEWMSEELHRPHPSGTTALCPECECDYVVADAEFKLNAVSLQRLHEEVFNRDTP